MRLARSFARISGAARPMLSGEKRKEPFLAACVASAGPSGVNAFFFFATAAFSWASSFKVERVSMVWSPKVDVW